MITSAKEFLSHLQDIRNENLHKEVLRIPADETIYNIDLNARTVDSPVYLSTETDHFAETIFFTVDRFFETHDLADSTCIIQYINAKNEPHIYIVPVFDIETFADEGKILLPWVIQGPVTVAAGPVRYAIRFYHINKMEDGLYGPEYYFDYIINTQPATSRILKGFGDGFIETAESPFDDIIDEEGEQVTPDIWQNLYNELVDILKPAEESDDPDHVKGALNLYWVILPD